MAYLQKHPDTLLAFLFAGLCCFLFLMPTGYESLIPQDSQYDRARVLDVDNSDIMIHSIVKAGTQELTAEMLTGPFKGHQVKVINALKGKMELDELFTKDQIILVEYSAANGKIRTAYSRGHYRISQELWLLGLFGLLLVVVGGWTGIKALLSFALSGLMLWKVMVPLFLKGYDPIPIALGVVAFLTLAISFLVGGATKRGMVTFLGAFLGLVFTCILALYFNQGFRIHGAVRPFAETLLYSGFYDLKITRIFLAGIFIASSGAVMDLAMDIAASMDEVKKNKPDISLKDHIKSGMSVGRAVIGTMTTTLLLAYSGGYMTMMMLFMAQGVPLVNFFNINYVAAEVLNTLVGSFGLVTVAPFTAVVGGFVYRFRSDHILKENKAHTSGKKTKIAFPNAN
ncbi:YibE/F family protein [Desulfobacter curvatus]|uniref:YibE/F family protein n=1 Tax=Desulfobacter curvatus TaxID=2290 RepID=UPI0003720C10|nr:YibE/F family protein [Desulfobacter curvatus]